jgi:hypothetical protein
MCETLRDESGRVTAIICGGRGAHKRCKFCGLGNVAKLCDFPVGLKKTCDAGMCARCATQVGADLDYCPKHKNEKLPEKQRNLFSGDSCAACEALARAAYNDGTTPGFIHSRCEEHREKACQEK